MEGACGNILVPHQRGGHFVFDKGYYKLDIREEVSRELSGHWCYWGLSPCEKAVVREWLEEAGVPLGGVNGGGDGVINNHYLRRQANLYFYQRVAEAAQPWPWPFRSVRPAGLID